MFFAYIINIGIFLKNFRDFILFVTKVVGGRSAKYFIAQQRAIGKAEGRKISSRKNAKEGQIVIANGNFGLSSKGLEDLKLGLKNTNAIKAHLEPKLDFKFSEIISTQIDEDYAMMDTSDGLADALFQIAKSSNVIIKTNKIEGMFGAEDYNLVATVPESFLSKLIVVNLNIQVSTPHISFL